MTRAVFRRRGRTLVPVDQEGLDLLGSIADESDVVVNVGQKRNPKHHRLFFAILNFCVKHAINPETGELLFDVADKKLAIENAKLAVKVASSEIDPFIDPISGKLFWVPRSMAYDAMDETRFSDFFDRAVYIITHRWMPEGTTEQSVRDEIMEMVSPTASYGRRAAPRRRQSRSVKTRITSPRDRREAR